MSHATSFDVYKVRNIITDKPARIHMNSLSGSIRARFLFQEPKVTQRLGHHGILTVFKTVNVSFSDGINVGEFRPLAQMLFSRPPSDSTWLSLLCLFDMEMDMRVRLGDYVTSQLIL